MAYDGWLVGHARWFRDAAGKQTSGRNAAWAASRSQPTAEVGKQ